MFGIAYTIFRKKSCIASAIPEPISAERHELQYSNIIQGTSMSINRVLSNSRKILYITVSSIIMSLSSHGALFAQDESAGVLEEVIVTATKREEKLLDVPISIATLSGENLTSMFKGGEDILALSGRVPGLYAESSNGRAAPRF